MELQCTAKEYRNHYAVSQSDLKAFAKHRWRYHLQRTGKLPKPGPTEAQQFGTRVESMLRGDDCHEVIVIPPEVLTSNGQRRGKKWEAWRDERDPSAQPCRPERGAPDGGNAPWALETRRGQRCQDVSRPKV